MSLFSSSKPSTSSSSHVKGANDIPAPRPDSAANAPPAEMHKRVMDFIQEVPNARYTFDSRGGIDEPDAELCRINPQGGRSCIKLAMQSKALFKSMQSLGFYCALPAEPTRTHMECNRIPR